MRPQAKKHYRLTIPSFLKVAQSQKVFALAPSSKIGGNAQDCDLAYFWEDGKTFCDHL